VRIEAVTVCVGYGDFIRETLPANLSALDDLVVVTSPDDDETRSICKEFSVRHILSEEHRRDGPFNKARLIQRGLDQIGAKDWILHLDADIVLPRKFRQLIDVAHLDERCIYGADRQLVRGWDAWERFKSACGGSAWDNSNWDAGHWFHPTFPPMSRWVSHLHGYAPIGAFQLFHGSAIRDGGFHLRRYPLRHGDAARTDVQFALQWDRRFRQLLPEVIVLHLDSGKSPMGANWEGRTTARFAPKYAVRSTQYAEGNGTKPPVVGQAAAVPTPSTGPRPRHDHHHHWDPWRPYF
jgi:glycosyltransferase involved in cell wall biosynthesis